MLSHLPVLLLNSLYTNNHYQTHRIVFFPRIIRSRIWQIVTDLRRRGSSLQQNSNLVLMRRILFVQEEIFSYKEARLPHFSSLPLLPLVWFECHFWSPVCGLPERAFPALKKSNTICSLTRMFFVGYKPSWDWMDETTSRRWVPCTPDILQRPESNAYRRNVQHYRSWIGNHKPWQTL